MSIALESHGNHAAIDGTATISVAASNAGDLIFVACSASNDFLDTTVPVLGISGGGLTWNLVGNAGGGAAGVAEYGATYVWYAVASGPVSATVTCTSTRTMGASALVYATFSGVVSPYLDPGTVPAIQFFVSSPTQSVKGAYTTTLTNGVLLAWPCSPCGSPGMTYLNPASPPGSSIVDHVTITNNSTGSEATTGLMMVAVPTLQTGTLYGSDVTSTDFTFIGCALVGLAAPGLPTGLSCGSATQTSITPTWTAPGDAVDSYTLQWRQVGAGSWNTITGIVTTSQVISGLALGTSYEWQVEAINGAGSSGFTASHVCNTLSVAPAPVVPRSLGRWRGAVGINWLGLALVGDAFSGVIGLSDFENFTEYGNVMRFLVTSPPLQHDRKRIFVPRLELDCQVGDGLPDTPEAAPVMMLDYSKDGGETFVGLQKWRSMGLVGEYSTRLRWLNLGQARSWVFRVTCTDVVRRQIIGVYVDNYPGLG